MQENFLLHVNGTAKITGTYNEAAEFFARFYYNIE